jgi:hypothetical protein
LNKIIKRIIILILLLSCLSFYGFAQGVDIGNPVIGYLSYGISTEAGNVIHTFGQEILFMSGGMNVFGLGVKINFEKSRYVFFTGYRYSLIFFSLGADLLVTSGNIGMTPVIELILPLIVVNFKFFFNYNIYFLQNNPASAEFGVKINIIDFFNN